MSGARYDMGLIAGLYTRGILQKGNTLWVHLWNDMIGIRAIMGDTTIYLCVIIVVTTILIHYWNQIRNLLKSYFDALRDDIYDIQNHIHNE